jgi:hypothetical protein
LVGCRLVLGLLGCVTNDIHTFEEFLLGAGEGEGV